MDQLTFSLDVATEGAESLRRIVVKKISELTGSSADDVLAEYVVVLVGHGKQRMQAVKDLEAFLGSQSEAFVTWLWDHLGSNIHLYTTLNKNNEKNEPVVLERTTESIHNSTSGTEPEEKSHVQLSSITVEGGGLVRFRRNPANNVRPGEETGKVPLLSGREKTCPTSEELDEGNTKPNQGLVSARPLKRQLSPESGVQSDRTTNANLSIKKRHSSPPRVNATHRLLQSAVREAVAHATGYSKPPVSSLKRLRSVVSTDTENSEDVAVQQPIKEMSQSSAIRPIKRATPAMMMAMKAAAAAAEDATSAVKPRKRPMPAMMMAMKAAAAAAEDSNRARGRLVGSSSDRLGKIKEEVAHEQVMFRQGGAVESRFTGPSDHGYEQRGQKKAKLASYSRWSDGSTDEGVDAADYTRESPGRAVHEVKDQKHWMVERDTEVTVSSDTYEDGKLESADDRMEQSREESVTVEYRLAQNIEGVSKDLHKQKGPNDASETNPSQKIVNISVNVNTWKPGLYERMKDTATCEQSVVPATTQQSHEQPDKAAVTDLQSVATASELGDVIKDEQHAPAIVKQSRESQLEKQSEVVVKEVQRVTLPAISGTKPSRNFQDDTETRTVFVTNIHFAATKEALTTHFSPCGDVARIIMLSDGATGQPKGSAYIEFKTVDAAERALTLNESSFYSRVLKVVRKDAAIQAIQELNPLIHPALIRRPIPVTVRLPLRGRLLRGSPYFLCRYPPTMPRPYGNFPSLQWKRDAAGGTLNTSLSSVNRPNFGVPVRPARSLSYVRASNSPVVPHQGATVEPNTFPQQQSGDNGVKSDLRDFSHEHKVTDKD